MSVHADILVLPAEAPEILHVCRHMRALDRWEAAETRWPAPGWPEGVDPAAVAADFIAARPRALVCDAIFPNRGGPAEPAALFAALETWPHVAAVAMIATDAWPEIALAATRWVRRQVVPALRAHGLHRAECRVLASHAAARRFLEACGARAEATLGGFGRSGADFLVYSWTKPCASSAAAPT